MPICTDSVQQAQPSDKIIIMPNHKFPTELHVSSTEQDKFNFEKLSENLLDKIFLQMELPNCFGLYGNWGSGKSTIINFINKKLVSEEKYKKIAGVIFEPWKYEYAKESDLLFALLHKIEKDLKFKEKKWKVHARDFLTIASWASEKFINVDPAKIKEDRKIFQEELFTEYESWIDGIEDFKKEFQSAVKKGLSDIKKEKVIIFIDDLDRCLPDNTIRLLEAIKNFLFVDQCLFVIAIDHRVVSEMIEGKYKLHQGYGNEYLMKIIHYFFELPRQKLTQYAKDLLDAHGLFLEESDKIDIPEFLQAMLKEPRKIKYYIHQFATRVTLADDPIEKSSERFKSGRWRPMTVIFVTFYLMTRFPVIFEKGNAKNQFNALFTCAAHGSHGNDYNRSRTLLSSLGDDELKEAERILRLGEYIGEPTIEVDKMWQAYLFLSQK